MTRHPSDARLNLSAGLLSVTVALVLVLAKVWALLSPDRCRSRRRWPIPALDLMMSLGGLAAIAYAAKPADDDHAFGHSSAEDLAALGQTIFILVSSGLIGVAAVLRLIDGTSPLPRTRPRAWRSCCFPSA